MIDNLSTPSQQTLIKSWEASRVNCQAGRDKLIMGNSCVSRILLLRHRHLSLCAISRGGLLAHLVIWSTEVVWESKIAWLIYTLAFSHLAGARGDSKGLGLWSQTTLNVHTDSPSSQPCNCGQISLTSVSISLAIKPGQSYLPSALVRMNDTRCMKALTSSWQYSQCSLTGNF